MTTSWVMGKPREKDSRAPLGRQTVLSPSLNFSAQREKFQAGNAICLPSLRGFLPGASGVNGGSSHSRTREKEKDSPLPQLCLEGEPTPPPALSLLPDENQMLSAPGTCGALCS